MSRMLRKRLAGFTLVEVLAAVSLLVLLAAAVMSFLGVLRERQKTVGDAYERQRGLALIMERMDAEITTCFADDGEGNAGINGTESSLKLGSRGASAGRVLIPRNNSDYEDDDEGTSRSIAT